MMSSMLRSGGGSGATLPALLAERDRLTSFIVGRRGAYGGVPDTIKAVGDYLHFRGAEVPGLRMYDAYPPWQQQSGLLSQELNKEAVLLEGPTVFFTLIKPHSRTALGGGTWKGTGKKTIGDEFVFNKLYYKDGVNRPKKDGFTAIEFLLKIDEPRVAICVLHRKDYRHLIQDLRRAAREAYMSLLPDLQSVEYHQAPQNFIANPPNDSPVNEEMYDMTAYALVHQDYSMSPSNTLPRNGDMNDMTGVRSHVDPQNYRMNRPSNILPNNGVMYDTTSRNIIVGGGYHPAPQNYPTDNMLIDMMAPNVAMLDEAPVADEVSMQNSSITSFGNSSGAIPPNQNATTSGEPLVPTFPQLQDDSFPDNDLQDYLIGDSDDHQLAGFFTDEINI